MMTIFSGCSNNLLVIDSASLFYNMLGTQNDGNGLSMPKDLSRREV